MKYVDFVQAVSKQRIEKYELVCGGDEKRVMGLYRYNVLLSSEFLAVFAIFEVILRNAIDRHYQSRSLILHEDREWLKQSIRINGFLHAKPCAVSKSMIQKALKSLGSNYSHDQLISELNFGFWRFLFAAKQFRAGGSSLLTIFPFRPKGTHQTQIFNSLGKINRLRNRAAHHEPIIFDKNGRLSLSFFLRSYHDCLEISSFLGYTPSETFQTVDRIPSLLSRISAYQSALPLLA